MPGPYQATVRCFLLCHAKLSQTQPSTSSNGEPVVVARSSSGGLGALSSPLLIAIVKFLDTHPLHTNSSILFRFSTVPAGRDRVIPAWLSLEYSVWTGSWAPPFLYHTANGATHDCSEYWDTNQFTGTLVSFDEDADKNDQKDPNGVSVMVIDVDTMRKAVDDDETIDLKRIRECAKNTTFDNPKADKEVERCPYAWQEGPSFLKFMKGGYDGPDYQNNSGCVIM